ncbi:sulfurtransferase TusA [Moraxella sp. ZY210820]|uniref:sulfurtransferase TusA n=1 Tax=unclassified Moraxella TaxID=2685852 RepID=UPI002731C8F1|nr:sulfurtransferase TusA [Moraxella sp. ZY210820]WLF84040.1 sulfurtransferase TusA [Moraxella sp. ZY210820]
MSDITPHYHLDTKGLRCPEPIMMLHRVMRKAQSGDYIEVIATDPSTSWDIPRFCTHLNHQLVEQQQYDEDNATVYRYLIQKG